MDEVLRNSLPLRDGYRTVTPYVAVRNAHEAHAFYNRAFNAKVVGLLTAPGGKIVHGALMIGDSIVVVVDEMPHLGLFAPESGGTCSILLSCRDADGVFARAVNEGATPIAPVADSFSGDRHGLLRCPFGHRWIISTRTEIVTDEEVERRWQKLLSTATADSSS